MKLRAEMKAQAMSGFTKRYWPVVGIALLGMVIIGVIGSIPAVGWLLSLLVGTIITVGLKAFFLDVYRMDAVKVESLFTSFNRYGRVLGGMLWRALWLFLWGLIFIIPWIVVFVVGLVGAIMSTGAAAASSAFANFGMMSNVWGGMPWTNTSFLNNMPAIFNPLWLLLLLLLIPVIIKSYSYFCTPYVLADSPDVHATDALTLSKKMMAGYKGRLFVTQLTFIGWFILCGITAGILWIFYVGPYFNATMAGFYQEVKEQAKQKGIAGAEALN